MRRSILRIAGFLLLLFLTLGGISRTLMFKFADGNQILSDFYQLKPNTVDLLVVGSSHGYVNYNNGTLWDEHGISSYNLGSSVQPMWNSYYYLKEALKTQTPELIILEGYGLSFDYDYSDESRIIKNTYGMRLSPDKIKAIYDSAPRNKFFGFLLDYRRFHTRYASLNKGDFFPHATYQDTNQYMHYEALMGQYLFDSANPVTLHDVTNVKGTEPLQEKTEYYYRKILSLAQSRNIPVLVVITPYNIKDEQQKRFLYAQEIAREYGAGFFNANLHLDEIGFDLTQDFHDTAHMTASGSKTYTHYIGQYLKEHYTLSDHRGEETYAAWERMARFTEHFIKHAELTSETDLSLLAQLLKRENYTIMISADGTDIENDPAILSFLSDLGISNAGENAIWLLSNGTLAWESGMEDNAYYLTTPEHDICLSRSDQKNSLLSDQISLQKVTHGLNVSVYDPVMDQIVDSFGIDLNKKKKRFVR